MHKRLVNDFVKTELKKGYSIDAIRAYLSKHGYKAGDIDDIMSDYEIREKDIDAREKEIDAREKDIDVGSKNINSSGTLIKVLSALLIILIIGNFAFFYMTGTQVKSNTPTAAVVADEEYQQVCEEYIREGKINVSEIKR
jgi:polyhydroxyalkanoate synthesis regulator phasin